MKKIIAFTLALIFCITLSTPFSVLAKDSVSGNELANTNPIVITAVTATAKPDEDDNNDENKYEDEGNSSEKIDADIDIFNNLGLNPNDYITRAQAVYILVNGLGDELKAVKPADLSVFADYNDIDPICYNTLGLAVTLGAINGSDDGMLHPNDYITRVEAFAIISRVLSQDELPDNGNNNEPFFTDIPDWAYNDILRLKNAGLIYGYGDGTMGSDDFMTYEQIFMLYERLLKYEDSLPEGSIYKDDYYSYVNAQWLAETNLPEGYARWSNIEQLSLNNAYRVQNIIGGITTNYFIGNAPPKGSNQQKILDVYRAAANVKYRDSLGIEPIVPYLEQIDDIDNITQFMDTMAELDKCGFHSLLPLRVNNDFKDSTKYSLSFEGCYTGISPSVIKSGEAEDIKALYKNYIRSLFVASGQSATEAEENAEDVTNLCMKLGNASMDETAWDSPMDIYNVYTKSQVTDLFSNTNVIKYVKNLGYNMPSSMVIYDKKLARMINTVLGGGDIELLKNYLKAAVLDYSSLYLNSETFRIYQNYVDKQSGVTSSNLTPDAYAITITQSLLGLEIGEEYVERYFSADSKKDIEELSNKIIETFEKRIQNLTWMSDATKKVAIEKLSAISVRIGYPDYLTNYTNNGFNVRSVDAGGNLMEYLVSYNKMINEQDTTLLNNNIPVNKEGWTLNPQTVNAYYDRANNCIVIPAGILQAPYYSPNASFESNLGGIGSIIAHEVTHAFDNVGSQFDKNGNLNDWWRAEDFTEFNKICKKFVSEYDKIEFVNGYFVDGQLTLSENIADIGGMACILDVAGSDNTNLDELFKTYARTYRTVCTNEYTKMLLITDEHSPNKVRVNMVLSNFDEFLGLYRIQAGNGMYRSKEDRLSIW